MIRHSTCMHKSLSASTYFNENSIVQQYYNLSRSYKWIRACVDSLIDVQSMNANMNACVDLLKCRIGRSETICHFVDHCRSQKQCTLLPLRMKTKMKVLLKGGFAASPRFSVCMLYIFSFRKKKFKCCKHQIS